MFFLPKLTLFITVAIFSIPASALADDLDELIDYLITSKEAEFSQAAASESKDKKVAESSEAQRKKEARAQLSKS